MVTPSACYSFQGRHYFANHIVHVTRAQSFDLRVPEAMSTHVRIAKTILVYCVAHTWLVSTPYANFHMLSPDHHGRLHNKELSW
jgi:hypothetical protein